MHNLLNVPVPPMLEETIGYDGSARWIAFYWMPAGDEAMYDDGRISGDGNWDAYLAFVRHPKVWPALAGYNLGNSGQEAEYWLVLDRETRVLHVAPEQDVTCHELELAGVELFLFRRRVYEAIATVYPELADECSRQLEARIRALELIDKGPARTIRRFVAAASIEEVLAVYD